VSRRALIYDHTTGVVSVDQEAFVDNLLDQYTMSNCNPCVLPMTVGVDLASLPLPDVSGKDIVAAYAKVVKQVLRYHKGVKHLKFTWCARSVKTPFQRGQIFGFTDDSWADHKSSLRNTLCAMFCVATVRPSHGNRLSLLFSLSLPGPTPIVEDNTGVITLFEHGHFKDRSKHVHLRVRLHRHTRSAPRSDPTPSHDQLADIGTKTCPAPQLKFQCSLLHGGLSLDRHLAKGLVFTTDLPP
jgi:hypothetical protein